MNSNKVVSNHSKITTTTPDATSPEIERKIDIWPETEAQFLRKPLGFKNESLGFHEGPRQRRNGARLVIWSWLAAGIDALMVMGWGMLFTACFSFIMKTSFHQVVVATNEVRGLLFFGFVAILSVFYMIMFRSYLGFTIGDWACHLRLGTATQRQSDRYILRVLLRSGLLLCTGIFVLPFVSLFLKKDLPGKISGLSLISLK
jgi:hypothetical protein